MKMQSTTAAILINDLRAALQANPGAEVIQLSDVTAALLNDVVIRNELVEAIADESST